VPLLAGLGTFVPEEAGAVPLPVEVDVIPCVLLVAELLPMLTTNSPPVVVSPWEGSCGAVELNLDVPLVKSRLPPYTKAKEGVLPGAEWS
jgi:hypothetical protein